TRRRTRRLRYEGLEGRELMTAVPAAPVVTATPMSGTQVDLAWHSVSGATGYLVDEWVNGAWKQIGNFNSGTTSVAVNGLNPHTTYYFDVAAYNSAGTDWANYNTVTTLQGAPLAPSVTATPTSSSQVNLSWNSVSGATGYAVDEWVNGAWKQIGNFNSGVTSVAVTGLNPNTTYYFDVAAYNSAGTTWANYNTVTTPSASVAINHPTAATAYSPVSGNLFGVNGPLFTDVKQGGVGDCWLMSSLAEVAARDSNDIRNMFTYQGTTVENGATVGLYSVRFYNSAGVAEHVTVDTELPSGGNYYDHATSGVLWVALAEKAYAEANGAGYVKTQHVGSDSYAALDGGDPTWALQAITGKPASDYSINPSNIAAAWNAGELIVLGSSSKAGDNLIVGDSQGTHAYAVVNYIASSSTPFELYNPWGASGLGGTVTYNGHQVYGGAFYATASMISQDFSSQSIGAGATAEIDTAGNSFLPVASAVGPTGSVAKQAQANAAIDQAFAAWNDDLTFAA
ncbi:MAG TPA: C2 family cysteine protease, partial [Pirellulales bacterium]|nr:C2 family cysteine protease [Pirellulales bacterium]